jgi:hypothetical protein
MGATLHQGSHQRHGESGDLRARRADRVCAERGVARCEFKLPALASKVARLVFGALQGALLVKRTTGDTSQLRDVVAVMKLRLAAQ